MNRRACFAAAAVLALIACRSMAEDYRLGELQEDLAQLERAVMTQHPFPWGNREEFAALLASRSSLLADGMDARDFLRVLTPAVAGIRCGHTGLSMPRGVPIARAGGARFFPMQVVAIDGRLFVLRDPSSAGLPPGSEILDIDGRPSAEIIATLLSYLSADGWNLTGKYHRLNTGFTFNTMYELCIDDPPPFSVTGSSPGGGPVSRAGIAAVGLEELRPAVGASGAGDSLPASRPYAGTVEGGCAILRIASFNFYDSPSRRSFEEFLDAFFDSMGSVRDLIIDLRGNGGGDPYNAAYLLAKLIAKETAYFSASTPGYADLRAIRPARNRFTGRLYVLIDGGCFSTTGHFCSLLRCHGIGILIGEETGGSFACTDNSRQIVLRNTGLVLRLSTTVFATDVSGLTPGRGIAPDHEVVATVEERLAGIDAPMAFTRRLVERRRAEESP